MGFLLDGLIVLLFIVLAVLWRSRPVSSALFSLLSIVLALSAAAVFASLFSFPLAENVFRPPVSRAAAYDLADLFSAPHLETGEATVQALSFDRMLEEGPAPFTEVLRKYGTTLEAVRDAYALSPEPSTVLYTVCRGMSDMLGWVVLFGVLWIVFAVLIRWGTRRIEANRRPPKRLKGLRRLWPLLAALVSAVGIVWGAALILERAVPYLEPRTLLISRDMLDSAQIYTILNRINPFAWLYFR